MSATYAPWMPEQVANLNRFQQDGRMHPFTCGGEDCREVLVAHADGWHCPKCTYTQYWAHDFMAEALYGKDQGQQGEADRGPAGEQS